MCIDPIRVITAMSFLCRYVYIEPVILLMVYRMRQTRLFNIQRLIMERVGFERAPNMSVHQMSDDRLRSTIRRHHAAAAAAATDVHTAHLPANCLAHRIITLLPACNYYSLDASVYRITVFQDASYCYSSNHCFIPYRYHVFIVFTYAPCILIYILIASRTAVRAS